MIDQDPQEALDDVQRKAAKLYEAVRKTHKSLNLPFAGEPLENGSPPQVGPGVILLPSRIEMTDLGQLITLVLNSWIQSREMPSVGQLHSSAQSSEVDQVVFITTLYSAAMLGAFLAQIGTGDLDTVSSILEHMTEIEEVPITSPDMYSRRPRRLAGLSTPAPSQAGLYQDLPDLPKDGKAVMTSTSDGKPKRKKKSYKSKGRRKKQKSTSK